jgi:hypothetical protein
MGTESIAALTAEGSFEYVEQGRLAQLPMAVRRVLNQRKLRSELADAKKSAAAFAIAVSTRPREFYQLPSDLEQAW